MPSRLLALTFESPAPARPARFWATVLGREVVADGDGLLLPGDDTQVGLRFAPGAARRVGQNRIHVHLTSPEPSDQDRTVAAALKLGAGYLDVGQRPDEGHIVLADPDGNDFCVIEAGNPYLAGCGFLGELACDGTREVGLFWSEALSWPLVWDQNEETAIQSPHGGTKIAWGGPPVAPHGLGTPLHFDLVPSGDDQATELDRMISLGATLLAAENGAITLADPDGNEFRLRAG